MAIDDFNIDAKEICGPLKYGDDSTPLVSKVPDPPPSHWGVRTSGSRFDSPEYLRFFYGKKKARSQKDERS